MSKLLLFSKKYYNSLSPTKKTILWFTFATIIQNAILFLVTPLYTRLLSDTEYGIFSVYQSWQQIVSIVAVIALDRCITVGFMKFEKHRSEFLSSVQALMTVCVAIFTGLICIFPQAATNITNLPVYVVIITGLVALANNSLANWNWLQRYNYNYIKLTTVTIATTILTQLTAILAIIFIPSDNKGILFIMAMAVARLLIHGLIYISVFIKGKTFYKKEYWHFASKYSIAVVPHALAQIILNSSDRIMIEKLCGFADAAFYGVTYSAAMILNVIVNAISTSVQPWFFHKIKEGDFNSIREQTNKLLLLSAGLSLGVSLFAPEILAILAPESYSAALWVFPSIAASIFFNSAYLYFCNFESYYEKPLYFSIATTTGAVVNIILNLLLIPIFGFAIAGVTTLICYMLFAVMHYLFAKKICREKNGNIKPFDTKYIISLSIVVLLATAGITFLYHFPIIRYATILLAAILVVFNHKNIKNVLLRIRG